jgi:hypothetical protein
MICKKCPHHVRHGQANPGAQSIVFTDKCGLRMKDKQDCSHYPFQKYFDYSKCDVYIDTFKGVGQRNDVVPTKDFQYTDAFTSSSITEMELL